MRNRWSPAAAPRRARWPVPGPRAHRGRRAPGSTAATAWRPGIGAVRSDSGVGRPRRGARARVRAPTPAPVGPRRRRNAARAPRRRARRPGRRRARATRRESRSPRVTRRIPGSRAAGCGSCGWSPASGGRSQRRRRAPPGPTPAVDRSVRPARAAAAPRAAPRRAAAPRRRAPAPASSRGRRARRPRRTADRSAGSTARRRRFRPSRRLLRAPTPTRATPAVREHRQGRRNRSTTR